MKSKDIRIYLDKVVTFRDVWNNFETAKLIELDKNFLIFEKEDGNKLHIKGCNIVQIQAKE